MLEGMDQIDWASLEHRGQSGSHILELLLKVASDNSRARADALVWLFAKGDYDPAFGMDFFETTPYIVALLLKMLSNDSVSITGKDDILRELGYVLDVTMAAVERGPDHAFRDPQSLAQNFRRLEFAHHVYLTFIGAEDIYKVLLTHSEYALRIRVCELLEKLEIDSVSLVAMMKERIEFENDIGVRTAIPYALASKFKDQDYWLDRFSRELNENIKLYIAEIYINSIVGWKRHWLSQRWQAPTAIERDSIPDEIVLFLSKGFLKECAANAKNHTPFFLESRAGYLLKTLLRLGTKELLRILATSDIDSETAHAIVRELLDYEIGRPDLTKEWTNYEKLIYGEPKVYSLRRPLNSRTRTNYLKSDSTQLPDENKEVLQAIVECEPFWQLPTNLFSFFYGLPDSRDELRALIEKS